MKYLFFYIVCFFMLFKSAAAVQTLPLPDDFEGKLTRQYMETYAHDKTATTTLLQNFNIFYEIGSYLYQKYPWEQITENNFTEKLKPFFPYDTDDELQSKHDYLVKTAFLYKMSQDIYKKFADKYLVPHAYRKIHNASEYDHPNEVKYIPTADDEYVKVYNFKKFLSYSTNIDEIRAISSYESQNESDILLQLDAVMEKIDWKKVWLYGTVYKNPLFSELGVGETEFGDGVNVRLIARNTYTESKKELDFGVQIATHSRYFVLANDLAANRFKPKIIFDKSKNISDVKVLYPLPLRTNLLPQAYKYFGNFIIPLKVTVENPDKPIEINAVADLTICDFEFNCQPQHFDLHLYSEVSGTDKFDNGFDTMFFNNLRRVPTANSDIISIEQFTAKNSADGSLLYLELTTSKKIKTFDIFVENTEEYMPFDAPHYVIDKNKIKAYIKPFNAVAYTDLSNTEYTISINLNNRYFYRHNFVADNSVSTSRQTINSEKKLFLPALCSGLILNLLPCIAPFTLILLLLFIREHKKHPNDRKFMQLSALKGSVCGLLTAVVLFIGQKYTPDYPLWGMQFSHPALLLGLIFTFAAFKKILPTILSAIIDTAYTRKRAFLFFIVGFIAGVLIIVSTSPYLSILMNTSVVASAVDAVGIISLLTVGFIIPQLFILYFPKKSQAWHALCLKQQILLKFIEVAFNITVIWLLLFIGFDCGIAALIISAIAVIIWMFLCEVFQKYLDYLNGVIDESITLKQINAIRSGSIVFMILLGIIFWSSGIYIANHLQTAENSVTVSKQMPLDSEQIKTQLQHNHPILLIVDTDWCFKCRFNRLWTINSIESKQWQKRYNLQIITINNIADIKQYMTQYGQYSLPLYILYTHRYPQGLILSSDIKTQDLEKFIDS